MIGPQLAHYRIIGRLGAGGMGEVYRARDERLGRDIALKVLPQAFAQDEQRMARFEREAQVLASLNHPNIATIYGLEEAGGVRALVMELVEGPTLADRIAQGQIPVEEALPIAKQICEALEHAHEHGIIHRDLKPANIKLTPDGKVKVLDFGLAKALEDSPAASDVSHSPTLSLADTRAGTILGTAAYMSPEQARGKPADRRADVWAFGAVLYEMLAGKKAFTGESVSDTLASVIKEEPIWDALPAGTSWRVRELLRRCMTKDPRRRLQAIGEARIAMDEALGGTETLERAAEKVLPRWRRALPWALASGLALVLLVVIWVLWPQAPQRKAPLRVSVELGADTSLNIGRGSTVILSPDGSLLAFVARKASGEEPRLYVRWLDQLQASPLPGTEGAGNPFFSPDGQWIAFFAGRKLKKISVTGGATVTLCEAPYVRGGHWAEDGTIVFAPGSRTLYRGALYRVSCDSFRADKPRVWSEGQFTDREVSRNFDLHPDGKRFAVLKTPETQVEAKPDKVVFIFNFFDELRRLAPTGRNK